MTTVKRWKCGRCWARAVERVGEAHDGRPRYQCQVCQHSYTKGWRGHEDDDVPSKHPSVTGLTY